MEMTASGLVDLESPDFIRAIMVKAKAAIGPGAEEREHKRIEGEVAALDRKISNLAGLLAETTAPEALLRKIEEMEQSRTRLLEKTEEVQSRGAPRQGIETGYGNRCPLNVVRTGGRNAEHVTRAAA